MPLLGLEGRWGGGGGVGGCRASVRVHSLANLRGRMLGTSSEAISRHRQSRKDCRSIRLRLQWHVLVPLARLAPAQTSVIEVILGFHFLLEYLLC